MKYLKVISLVLAIVCLIEVYYMHSILSFIDYPYLYVGGLALSIYLFVSIYLFIKRRK